MIRCGVNDLCLRIPYYSLHAAVKQETERKHDVESDVRIEMLDTEAIRMGLLVGLLPEVGDDRKEGRLEAGQE